MLTIDSTFIKIFTQELIKKTKAQVEEEEAKECAVAFDEQGEVQIAITDVGPTTFHEELRDLRNDGMSAVSAADDGITFKTFKIDENSIEDEIHRNPQNFMLTKRITNPSNSSKMAIELKSESNFSQQPSFKSFTPTDNAKRARNYVTKKLFLKDLKTL